MKKPKFKRIITSITMLVVAAAIVAVPMLDKQSADAANNAQLYLSPASQSVTVGSNIVLNVMLNSGGNQVITTQASLSFSTSYFNLVSVQTAAGSPFDNNPNASDVYSPGTLRIARATLNANGSTYSGPIATITLATKTTGSTSINFANNCASTADLSACSAVIERTDTTTTNDLLASTTGGNYTINVVPPATTTGGTTTKKSTTKKTTTSGSTATTTTPVTTPTTTTAEQPAEETPAVTTGVVRVTVVDSKGKPVEGAVVNIGGVSGTTDKNGVVTLTGLTPGQTATGTIKYKGVSKTVSIDVSSTSSDGLPQTEKFTINASNASKISPATIGIVGVIVLAVIAFLIAGPGKGKGMKGFHGGFSSHSDIPTVSPAAIVTSEKPAPLVTPHQADSKPAQPLSHAFEQPTKTEAKPSPQTAPEPKPAAHSGALHKRLDPMSPGTVVRPTTTGFHATNIKQY